MITRGAVEYEESGDRKEIKGGNENHHFHASDLGSNPMLRINAITSSLVITLLVILVNTYPSESGSAEFVNKTPLSETVYGIHTQKDDELVLY